MLSLNAMQAYLVIAIGLGLITFADKLARIPHVWREFRGQARKSPRPGPPMKNGHGVRALVVFWRICGVLWIVGGVFLLRDASLTVRIRP